MEDVIVVEHLYKIYRFYSSSIARLKELLNSKSYHEEIVALKDISLRIKKGEAIGIVGDNGAGKSTLLQIIAGALHPTSGRVSVKGKVLALLELGLGFHPDFTGRQNIYFYGDILGYPRKFVKSKMDEIIEFSELGDFIDRPLKTYSTGMQMRLAFSLAVSLDPDILVIDEALAVGDLHFQKKCIDRILEFKEQGKTILFCSHSTYQISIFCNRVLWLKNGMIEMFDITETVIPAYEFYQLRNDRAKNEKAEETKVAPVSPVIIEEFKMLNSLPLRTRDDLRFYLKILSESEDIKYHVSLSLKMDTGRGVFVTGTHLFDKPPLQGRKKEIFITFPSVPLLSGQFYAHARVLDEQGLMLYHQKILPPFTVVEEIKKGVNYRGVCYLEHQWDVK